jgi:hypothetical protein
MGEKEKPKRDQPSPATQAGSAPGDPLAAAGVIASASADKGARGPSLDWATVLQLAAVVAGALLLYASYTFWHAAPAAQVGTAADVNGTQTVVVKKTTTTAEDGTTTVVEEPALAVSGRSEAVVIAFLALGTILLVAAALPGRNLTLKAGVVDATLGTVVSAAAQEAETSAKKKGADAATVQAVGTVAAQEAAVRLPANYEKAQPGSVARALDAVSGGRLGDVSDPGEVAATAAQETVKQAGAVALARVMGTTDVAQPTETSTQV